MNRIITFCTLLALGACVSQTPYQAAQTSPYGYTDQQLDANKFRITFSGNAATARQTIENYLLYRAAEITKRSGNDYFEIVSEIVEPKTSYSSITDYGGYYGFGYGYPYYGGYSPYLTGGTGFSTTSPSTSYTADATILVYAGQRPVNDPRAYDAGHVLANLGPTLQYPKQG